MMMYIISVLYGNAKPCAQSRIRNIEAFAAQYSSDDAVCGRSNGIANRKSISKKYAAGMNKKDYWEAVFDDSMDLIARLPRVAAYIYRRKYKFGDHIQPNGCIGLGRQFCAHDGILKMKVLKS
jgi:hypothetical protein